MSLPLQAVNTGIIDATGWFVGLASLAFVVGWLLYLLR
jgi:fatty acid desaturase